MGCHSRGRVGGEAHVESAQGQHQHYGNSGMNSERADEFILHGHARANAKKRARLLWNTNGGEWRDKMPSWMRGLPLFYDHLRLKKINDEAATVIHGWVPFSDVFNVKEDNGERFLSEYYREQQQRDQQRNSNDKIERCPCLACASSLDPLPHRKKAGDHVQDAAIGLGDDLGDEGVWGGDGLDWADDNDDLLTGIGIDGAAKLPNMSTMTESSPVPVVVPPTPTRGVPTAASLPMASNRMQQQQHVPMQPSPFHLVSPNTMMGMGGMGGMHMMMQMQQQMQQIQMQQQMMMAGGGGWNRKRRGQVERCCDLYVQDRNSKKPGRPRHDINCPARYI